MKRAFLAKLFKSGLCSLLLILGLCGPAAAHPMDEWFTELHWTTGKGLTGRFRVPLDQREKLAKTPIVFSHGGLPLAVTWTAAGAAEDGRVLLDLTAPSDQPAAEIRIDIPPGLLDDNQSLVGFLTFDGGEPSTVMIPAGHSKSVQLPTQGSMTGEGATPTFGLFFKFGLKHILEGFDHLLFLFCLLIAGGTLRHLVVVVTAFTLGHSVTLALSVLGVVSLPSTLTESLIAFSIIVAALWNLRLPEEGWPEEGEGSAGDLGRRTALSRGALAGGFGLIHGLGFASMLKESGLSEGTVVMPLVGFNLGVEAGQLALVLMFYPILYTIHRSAHRRAIVAVCSVLAACCGLLWLLERLGLLSLGG